MKVIPMKVHFIGIGGIGISALAQYYLAKGNKVSGSELKESEITQLLRKKGATIFIGHKSKNLSKNVDLVIYSSAIPKDNPELKRAKEYKLPLKTYPQALGELTKKYFTIAISGTHGKSTTTAMTSLILIKAGLDPTVIVGTKLKEFGNSNFRMGAQSSSFGPPILVIEACEYEKAFLNYFPKIIVITNIEREHLDYYKNLKNILSAFKEFISHLPENGYLVANKDDKNVVRLLRSLKKITKKYYSLRQKEDVNKLKSLLKIPGTFNVQNALAALSVARILKIPDKISFKALSGYKGAWRRFEIFSLSLNNTPFTLISDYAHHPTEIKATVQAAREKFRKRRIILVFQPHQYQRTKLLFKDFVNSFDNADYLILNEIYGVAGRDQEKNISSKDLKEAVKRKWKKRGKEKNVEFIKDIDKIPRLLSKILKRNDVLIIMGAGNIYNLVPRLKIWKKKNQPGL